MKVEKVFCTTSEAASILAISVGTVQLWVDNGLLEAWKTAGGHRRVTRESINKILHASPAAQPKTPASTASQTLTAERMRVLVVEDDRDLLRLYQTMLSRWPMVPKPTMPSVVLIRKRATVVPARFGSPCITSFANMIGARRFWRKLWTPSRTSCGATAR